MHFLRLHVVVFAVSTIGIVVAYFYILNTPEVQERPISGPVEIPPDVPPHQHEFYIRGIELINYFDAREQATAGTHVGRGLMYTIKGLILLPTFVGVIMSAILNSHSYLILGQQHCYASFVSSRSGYLNVDIVSVSTKLATFLRLNV